MKFTVYYSSGKDSELTIKINTVNELMDYVELQKHPIIIHPPNNVGLQKYHTPWCLEIYDDWRE